MKRKTTLLVLGIFTALVMMSCAILAPQPTETVPSDAILTQVAEDLYAQLTKTAFPIPNTGDDATQPAPAATDVATQVPPTATQVPPTATPVPPTATPLPPTPTPIPCDWAHFVKDVTIADGSVFAPGESFTKVWRLQNRGSCAWTSEYDLIFVTGDRMSGDKVVPMPGVVRPGESVDIGVDLVAPSAEGHYRGYWTFRNEQGLLFGSGESAKAAIFVDIQVSNPANPSFDYDFAANYCAAEWRSSAGLLPCPGSSGDEDGSVNLLDKPTLESGRTEDELTLWTRPEVTNNGWIQGTFPAYKVRDGQHFLADIGCLADSKGCDVTFTLDYLIDNGGVRNLGVWHETYDGHITRIDVDLSSLAGRKVQFVMTVTANSHPSKANAFWLVPSLRQSPAPVLDTDIPAVKAARKMVAGAVGVDQSVLSVLRVEATEWSDTCLGVYLPDRLCSPSIVPGYRAIFSTGSRQYEAHTNQDGSIIFWFEI